MSSAVRLEVRPDRVAVLTLDQPGRSANVLTAPFLDELDAALADLERASGVAGLVIASAKRDVFSAGTDLTFFAALPGPNDPACRAYIERGLAVLDRLERLPFPTCAALDGVAVGGGLELALACDLRVCGTNPRAEFGLPEVRFGLIPGWGGTQRLPRVIGLDDAAALLMTGRPLAAPEAVTIGLVGALVASADVLEVAAREVVQADGDARQRKRRPVPESARAGYHPTVPHNPIAVREAVSVLVDGAKLPLAAALRLETQAFLRLAGSDESKRRIAEFFARRKG